MQLADIRHSPHPLRILLSGLLPAHDIVRICSECRALPPGTVRNHLVTEGFIADMAKIAVLKTQTNMAGIPPAIRDEPVIQRLLQQASTMEGNILDRSALAADWWTSLGETFKRWFQRSNLELPADFTNRVWHTVNEKSKVWLDSISHQENLQDTETELGRDQDVYDLKKKFKDVSSHVDDEYTKEKVRKDRELADKDARKKTKRERKKLRDQPLIDQLAQIISGGIDKIDAKSLAALVHQHGALEISRLLKFLKDTGEMRKLKAEDFNAFCVALLTEGPLGWLKKTFWDNPMKRMKDLQDKAQRDRDTGADQSGMHNFAGLFSPESRKQLGRSSLRKAINGWVAAQAIKEMHNALMKATAKARLKTAEVDDFSGPLFKREPDTGKKMPVPASGPALPPRPKPPAPPPEPEPAPRPKKRRRWSDTEFE